MSARTISGQDARTPHAETPCPGCGARRFDRGRFFDVYRLCAYCFADEEQRAPAGDRWRLPTPERAQRIHPHPCEPSPATEGKTATWARRLPMHLALHHPADRPIWGTLPATT